MVGGTALAVSLDGETSPVLVVGLAAALVAIHLGAGRVGLTGRIPRSGWLSFAGGTSIAYVFVHLLPELEAGGREIAPVREALPSFLEYHVYLVALVGFVVFYGLERFVTRARASDGTAPDGVSGDGVFWIHIGSFALYNALVGYSLYERETALTAVLFAVAMGSFTSSSTTPGSAGTTRFDTIESGGGCSPVPSSAERWSGPSSASTGRCSPSSTRFSVVASF